MIPVATLDAAIRGEQLSERELRALIPFLKEFKPRHYFALLMQLVEFRPSLLTLEYNLPNPDSSASYTTVKVSLGYALYLEAQRRGHQDIVAKFLSGEYPLTRKEQALVATLTQNNTTKKAKTDLQQEFAHALDTCNEPVIHILIKQGAQCNQATWKKIISGKFNVTTETLELLIQHNTSVDLQQLLNQYLSTELNNEHAIYQLSETGIADYTQLIANCDRLICFYGKKLIIIKMLIEHGLEINGHVFLENAIKHKYNEVYKQLPFLPEFNLEKAKRLLDVAINAKNPAAVRDILDYFSDFPLDYLENKFVNLFESTVSLNTIEILLLSSYGEHLKTFAKRYFATCKNSHMILYRFNDYGMVNNGIITSLLPESIATKIKPSVYNYYVSIKERFYSDINFAHKSEQLELFRLILSIPQNSWPNEIIQQTANALIQTVNKSQNFPENTWPNQRFNELLNLEIDEDLFCDFLKALPLEFWQYVKQKRMIVLCLNKGWHDAVEIIYRNATQELKSKCIKICSIRVKIELINQLLSLEQEETAATLKAKNVIANANQQMHHWQLSERLYYAMSYQYASLSLCEIQNKFKLYPKDNSYSEFGIDPDEFKKIIILILCAAKLEKTSENEIFDNAHKLAAVFGTYEATLTYLVEYQNNHPETPQPIHDACLFNISNTGPWPQQVWRRLLAKYGPKILRIIGHAATLENGLSKAGPKPMHLFKQDCLQQELEKVIRDEEFNAKLQATIAERRSKFLANLDKAAKGRARALKSNDIDSIKKQLLAKFELAQQAYIKQQQLALANQRAAAWVPAKVKEVYGAAFPDHEVDLEAMTYDEIIHLTTELAYADLNGTLDLELITICSRHGLPKDVIQKIIDFYTDPNNKKTEDNIPEVLVENDEFYLTKLPSIDGYVHWRGFILGLLTNCCQHIAGHSENVVFDGMKSRNGGFYLLCRKQGKELNPCKDEVVAQSWVWTNGPEMVFDSLEYSATKHENHKPFVELYQRAAHAIIADESNPIVRVTLGAGGATPRNTKLAITPSVTPLKDTAKYPDSARQLLLADKNSPDPQKQKLDITTKHPIETMSLNPYKTNHTYQLTTSSNSRVRFFQQHPLAKQVITFETNNLIDNELDPYLNEWALSLLVEQKIVAKATADSRYNANNVYVVGSNTHETLASILYKLDLKEGEDAKILISEANETAAIYMLKDAGKIKVFVSNHLVYASCTSALCSLSTIKNTFADYFQTSNDSIEWYNYNLPISNYRITQGIIALKMMCHFAKHGKSLFQELEQPPSFKLDNNGNKKVNTNHLPAKLTKLLSINHDDLTKAQLEAQVSAKRSLTLQEYRTIHEVISEDETQCQNGAALIKQYKYLEALETILEEAIAADDETAERLEDANGLEASEYNSSRVMLCV